MGFTPITVLVLMTASLIFMALIIYMKVYTRTEAGVAFVRTGMGGMQVVLDGGTIVFPVIHEITPVSLMTMEIEVQRHGADSIVTEDGSPLELTARVYVRTPPTKEAVERAARSLSGRSMILHAVIELIEPKIIEALRLTAANMPDQEIASRFAEKFQECLANEIVENGLKVESVAFLKLEVLKPLEPKKV